MVIVFRIWREDTVSKETLSDIYHDIFEKHKADEQTGNFVIPVNVFEYWRSRLENIGGKEKDTRMVNQRKTNAIYVHIVNTSINTLEKSFEEELRHTLEEEDMIEVTEGKAFRPEMSECGGSIILIVDTSQNENVHQTVEKCLNGIEEEQLKNTIVVALHANKELPSFSSSASNELANDYHGKCSEIKAIIDVGIGFESDKNALQTIKDFCLKSKEQNCQIDTSARRKGHDKMTQKPVPNNPHGKHGYGRFLYIVNPSVSPATTNFVDNFLASMEDIGIPLVKIPVADVTNLDKNDNLIVVCNNKSRVITDLESCLEGVSRDRYSHTVVIVLHTGLTMPVPVHRDEDGQFKDLREIIDMSWDRQYGILDSPWNNDAYESLKRIYPVRNACCECCACCIN